MKKGFLCFSNFEKDFAPNRNYFSKQTPKSHPKKKKTHFLKYKKVKERKHKVKMVGGTQSSKLNK